LNPANPGSSSSAARRLACAALLSLPLLAAAEVRGQEREEPSHCPFNQANLKDEGTSVEKLRPAPPIDSLPGIRFSHISALSPSEVEEPAPNPHQVTRQPVSAFHPWEFVQLGVLVACAVAVVWLAHRKLEG